jgi:hypothetical protein
MPYNPNIPQPTDNPSVSQSQMLGNFSTLATDFAVNHIPLTSGGATAGYHTQIWFPAPLSADPGLTAPQASLYTKTSGGASQLFYQNGALASNVVQLTGLSNNVSGSNYGFATPFGFIMNMGQVSTGAVTYALPFSTTIYTVLMTVIAGAPTTNWSILTSNLTGFTYQTSNANFFYYFAMGV